MVIMDRNASEPTLETIDKRLDKISTLMSGFADDVNKRLKDVGSRFDQIDIRFDKIEARLDAYDKQFKFPTQTYKWLFESVNGNINWSDRYV